LVPAPLVPLATPRPGSGEEEEQPSINVDELIKRWLNRYSREVAAWIMISPFPIELLPERIMQLAVRMTNQPGSFLKSVVQPVTRLSGAFLQVEGMTTGDESSLIL
jgi:hypothetical protein